MGRAILLASLPWLGLLVLSLAAACGLAWLLRARPQFKRLVVLHRNEAGGAQSLSFVLTLPLFIWLMLFIVQMSQLVIGTVVVNYAAYAAARAAIVWIPARAGMELENCISTLSLATDVPQDVPTPVDPYTGLGGAGPQPGGVTYVVDMTYGNSVKVAQIRKAALMALAAISPSRSVGVAPSAEASNILPGMLAAYGALANDTSGKAAERLQNKLAYASQNMEIELRGYHPNSDPPLQSYFLANHLERAEFLPNEIGFQDPLTVTLKYKLALLPGVGKVLGRDASSTQVQDTMAGSIGQTGGYYTYDLSARITLPNEGQISSIHDP